MAGVAGSNIANAAGRPDADSPYNPWTSAVVQFPIGPYVEAPTEDRITADTNYMGMNSKVAYKTNVLAEGGIFQTPTIPPQPDWIVPDNDNDARGGTSQWVRAAGTIAENGTCTVAAGAATAGAGTFSCYVTGGVVAGDFFWAVVTAES